MPWCVRPSRPSTSGTARGTRKVPLLVVAGQQDPVVPPELARTGTPDEFAVLPGCGHLPPAEDPAAVADLLARFFRPDR